MRRLGIEVRADERASVAAAAAVIALCQCGYGLVASGADALFLARVGPRHLGTVFAASSALLIATLFAVGGLADRADRRRLLAQLAVVAAVATAGAAAAVPAYPGPAAVALLVLGKQLGAALDLAFYVSVTDRFDARQARRLLPLFVLSGGAGLAVGAFLVAPVAALGGAEAAVIGGAVAWAAAAAVAHAQSAAITGASVAWARSAHRVWSWRAGWDAVRGSGLARSLAAVVAIAGVFAPILYYLLAGAAAAELGSERAIASFLGQYRGAVQLVTLVAQAFVAPALLARAGVAPTLLVAPLGAIAAAVGVAVSVELAVLAVAQASARVLDTAVQTPAERLVHNLLPRHLRGRVAGFVDGVAKRGGAIAGGLLASTLVVWSEALAAATIAVGLAWLAATWRMRTRFAELAVAELAARTLEPVADDQPELAMSLADDRAIERVRAQLRDPDARRRELAAELIATIAAGGRVDAGRELAAAARALPPGARGELLARIAAPTAACVEDLLVIARDGGVEGGVAVRALSAIGHGAAAAIGELPRTGAVGVAVRAALARAGDGGGDADAIVDAALAHADGEVRDAAVHELITGLDALDGAGLGRRARRIAAAAARPELDAAARADGLAALARELAARPRTAELALTAAAAHDAAAALAGDHEPAVRAAALQVIAAHGERADVNALARGLSDGDEPVRRAAAEGLRAIGGSAVAALLVAARFGRRSTRNSALEVLRDLRLHGAALDDIAERELDDIARAVARLDALAALPRSGLLVRRQCEVIDEIAQTLFLTLEARLHAPAIGEAARRFAGARGQAARARALEALDAALPRAYARVIELLEAGPLAQRAARASARLGTPPPATDAAVREVLTGGDALARALVIHALGAEGRAEHRDDIRAAASEAARALDPVSLVRRIVGGAQEDDMPRSIERMLLLSRIPLFAELSTRQLAGLAEVVRWEAAQAGEVIVEQGDPGDAMYFVVSGDVTVTVDAGGDTRVRETLGAGEPFGEMALFETAARSATVTAATRARLGRIDRADFEELVDDLPGIALAVCRVLSRRLRVMNAKA